MKGQKWQPVPSYQCDEQEKHGPPRASQYLESAHWPESILFPFCRARIRRRAGLRARRSCVRHALLKRSI
jgi:hypothetical protein